MTTNDVSCVKILPTARAAQTAQDAEETAIPAGQPRPLQEWTPEFLKQVQRQDTNLGPISSGKKVIERDQHGLQSHQPVSPQRHIGLNMIACT